MGGRGASSGISSKGIRYGKEFSRILAIGNNIVKYIVFYGPSGKIRRQIDLDHKHLKQVPQAHEGDATDRQNNFQVKLTRSDQMYIKKIRRIWKEYQNE